MNTHLALQELQGLNNILQRVQTEQLRTSDVVQAARASQALVNTLPEKYAIVLNDILDRLESGALFTEESCSFSQRDLLDSLAMWAEKAGKQLTQIAS